MRNIAAVILGYVLWTILWLAGNAGLAAAGILPKEATQRVEAPMPQVFLLLLSLVCSLAAGCVAARVARTTSLGFAFGLGLLLLATGCFVQSTVWKLMPIWYHVVFLGLLVPATLVGWKFKCACCGVRSDANPSQGTGA